jgi:hypothetical protein
VGNASLVKAQFTGNSNRFEGRGGPDRGDIDTRFVDILDGGELDTPFVGLANGVVCGAFLKIKRSKAPFLIGRGQFWGCTKLGHFGIAKRTLGNSMDLAPAKILPLWKKFLVAFDAFRFGNTMFSTPLPGIFRDGATPNSYRKLPMVEMSLPPEKSRQNEE